MLYMLCAVHGNNRLCETYPRPFLVPTAIKYKQKYLAHAIYEIIWNIKRIYRRTLTLLWMSIYSSRRKGFFTIHWMHYIFNDKYICKPYLGLNNLFLIKIDKFSRCCTIHDALNFHKIIDFEKKNSVYVTQKSIMSLNWEQTNYHVLAVLITFNTCVMSLVCCWSTSHPYAIL